ncbi:MAG: gene transfer agent family protein [Alphaproteobacteria bacterium]
MANRHRGEITAMLGGRARTLCLTLGALAELETALGGEDMLALATRFEAGRLRAADAIAILGAGLRGAGEDISDADVATMKVEGGAVGYVTIVSQLLAATFAPIEPGDSANQSKKKV